MKLAGYDPNETISSGTITASQWNKLEPINEGSEEDMMGLYEVIVVNTKTNEFIVKHTVIAKDATRAQMKTVRKQDIDVTNDDIKFFVVEIGQWESRKPKEVKIVKEE